MSGVESVVRDLLNSLGNSSLQLDPVSQSRLAALEGKTIRFEVELPGRASPVLEELTIRDGRACLEQATAAPPNAVVRGSPADFMSWLAPGSSRGGLEFSGDELLLEQLSDLFARFRPDMTEPLSRLVGEAPLQALLGAAEAGLAVVRSALQGAGNAVEDTAQEFYVGDGEFNKAMDRLDTLQLRIDRLSARVREVEQKRNAVHPASAQRGSPQPNRQSAASAGGSPGKP